MFNHGMRTTLPGPWEAALLAAASYRLWRLAAEDSILDGPRDRILTAAPEWVDDMIVCAWCLGFWISGATYLSWRAAPRPTLAAAVPLAISAAVGTWHHLLNEAAT